ncbi:Shikimate dehydrogenase (NADP(+)) [Microbacterium oleivorans]|uniref:shikimate dehydrogenase family protein n=1 Tax=Microbacterium oleivorans TaxID=273677 RepID=UPI0009767E0A|nr:shikimate dehydrogenase [Microbacterium oleivorans]AZS43819.1 Shikimate dehydrogenase (NADP(+)) [Microbacterium oleivorans]
MASAALEVWGDPIAHSLSPAMHSAAYAFLGWDWTYGRRRVDESTFATELASLDPRHRGLSLTMPLKHAAFDVASERDAHATVTGAANTLIRSGSGWRAFHTDAGGIVAALREQGVADAGRARIVGAGATASAALVALSELGVREVEVAARRPDAAAGLVLLGERIGVRIAAVPLSGDRPRTVDVTIATLPGGVSVDPRTADALAETGGVLMDVVYGHWPTDLARAWERVGQSARGGEGMLLHQAVLQIRAFATGDVEDPLPREDEVVAVMRRALVGD